MFPLRKSPVSAREDEGTSGFDAAGGAIYQMGWEDWEDSAARDARRLRLTSPDPAATASSPGANSCP